MLYRYTTALLLAAIVVGACTQPQEGGISPDTATPSTTKLTMPPASKAGVYIVSLIDEAIKACSGEQSLMLGSNCTSVVRGVCNAGKQFLTAHENDLQPGDRNTTKFICDLAALAEAEELVFVLQTRYRDGFVPPSSTKYCRFSRDSGAGDFSLLQVIIDFWRYQLWYLIFVSFDPDNGSVADIEIPCMVVERGYNVYDYENIHEVVLEKLKPLFFTISRIWSSIKDSNEQQNLEYILTKDVPPIQGDETSSLSELEYFWQQLPHVCSESISDTSTENACHMAAFAICEQYGMLNLEAGQAKPWYTQSPKNPETDFACGLAGDRVL